MSEVKTSAPKKPTYEEALAAAKKVREYMDNHTCIRGPQWVWPTFDLEYILQEWKFVDTLNGVFREDFQEEYDFIHAAATFNWHMYEEGPEYI